MPDIKIRTVAEKTVKTIDKSAIAAQRMKTAYVQTKEKAERSVHTAEETPEGYAANRISDSAINTIHEGVRQFDRQGRKGLAATKENISKLGERFQRKRLTDPLKKKAQKQAGRSASPPANAEGNAQRVSSPIRGLANGPKKAVSAVRGEQAPAKTVGQVKKAVKQTAKSTGRATVKTAKKP